jgi:hypothetical protein
MPVASAHEDLTKPEIKVEKKKDGLYMYIDGVKVHETDTTKQPLPKVVTSGAAVGAPPSDAVVLFDGSEKSFKENWSDTKGGASKWKIVDGAMESVRGAGYIQSKAKFGSCQLHIEWASPAQVKGNGQGRGNSGVFLMGTYEFKFSIALKTRPTPTDKPERSTGVPSHS